MANKAYKFRIYPNREQKTLFAKTFGCVRFIYNKMLDDKIKYYEKTKKKRNNTPAQYKKEFPWLKEVDSLALANAQMNLQKAYNNFFRDPKVGFPKFKSRHKTRASYTTNNQKGTVALENGHLKLPKAGYVKVKQHRAIPEDYRIKSVTISQNPDFSMHELYRDSNGNEPAYPGYYRKAEQKLKREQRKLSKMQKGSKNRGKQRIRVARMHEKVAAQRRDFLHKQSRKIADAYDCVCIEDLDMKAMSQALHFGKSVLDNGWGIFVNFLKYKMEEQGKQLVKVGRFFASSQLCSVCGYKNTETKDLRIRAWICPKCGTHHDRDVNAAVNIRNEGMRLMYSLQ